MLMDRPPVTNREDDDAARWRWLRVRQRRTLVTFVLILALLTAGQGFESGRTELTGADGEGVGRLTTSSELVDLGREVEAAPLAPPALPSAQPIEVDAPAGPAQTPAQPSPRPSPRPEIAQLDLSPVTAQQPRIKLRQVAESTDDPVQRVLEVDGVSFATSVEVAELPIVSEKEGVAPVRVAAVDPNGFRVLTPQVTADAVEVWQRIAEGDAAFTHDVGTRLALELGSRVPTSRPAGPVGDEGASSSEHAEVTDGPGATDEVTPTAAELAAAETIRVGAYASNGVPPIADAVVSKSTLRELGLRGTQEVLVSVAEGVDPEQLASRSRS
jgi:hypothetical protein